MMRRKAKRRKVIGWDRFKGMCLYRGSTWNGRTDCDHRSNADEPRVGLSRCRLTTCPIWAKLEDTYDH